MRMVIELSSVYEGSAQEIQKISSEIREIKNYTEDMPEGTVYEILKGAERSKQQLLKNKVSALLEKLSYEDVELCSTSREEKDDENKYFWS